MLNQYVHTTRHTDDLYYGLVKLTKEEYVKAISSGQGFWKPRIPIRYRDDTFVYELVDINKPIPLIRNPTLSNNSNVKLRKLAYKYFSKI